jgi:hypothetical protein
MNKKLKALKQTSSSSLNLRQGKSKLKNKKRSKILAVKATLKTLLSTKKPSVSDEIYNEKKYSDYFTEIFNSKIIYMIIVYINKNKEKLKNYKYDKEPNFINKFINLIKELCLNEIEVSYLTLLLDKLGWNFENINHWIYFYSLGVYTKQMVTNDYESDELLELKEEIKDKYYPEIVNHSKFEEFERKGIQTKEVNQRFKELTKPINSFCRRDFIIYSSIADKIIRLSQPYGEESNANQLFKEKDKEEEEKQNNLNDINEGERVLKSLFGNNYPNYLSNVNNNFPVLSLNVNDVKNFNQKRNQSIIAEKKNFNADLNLANFGSNLSLIKRRSDNSFNSDFHSANNF